VSAVVARVERALGVSVVTGVFGADLEVDQGISGA
jgi:hypothetical protein